jgi:hypothetical protein
VKHLYQEENMRTRFKNVAAAVAGLLLGTLSANGQELGDPFVGAWIGTGVFEGDTERPPLVSVMTLVADGMYIFHLPSGGDSYRVVPSI